VRTGHSSTKLTYADYVLFPDDGLRHEIIEGDHYVTPAPVTRHQRISRELLYLLHRHLKAHPSGEVFAAPFDVILSDTNVFVPDLVYISNARAHLLTEKNLQGSPDIAIEILSPGTKHRDRGLKLKVYERLQVEEYWLVDPDLDVVNVYRRGRGGFDRPKTYGRSETMTTPLVPGLEILLAQVFASPSAG
jgi:Uma2 family endonuclease